MTPQVRKLRILSLAIFNMQNTTKSGNEINISNISANLNFAYCPSSALIINSNYIQNSEEFIDLSKNLDKESISYMSNAMRYFYICYSLKLENINSELDESNYFYFQLFSQIGDQQSASQPVYGFFEDEKILELIKDIDYLFEPEKYDKQIFDTFHVEIAASASELIKLMQQWTNLKLLTFNNLYFKDFEAVENLHKLIQRGKILEKQKPKKPKPKTKLKTKPKSKPKSKPSN